MRKRSAARRHLKSLRTDMDDSASNKALLRQERQLQLCRQALTIP